MANIVRDHHPAAYVVRVRCFNCGHDLALARTFMDLDGPSFQAYYCPRCAEALLGPKIHDIRCDHPGCVVCGGPRQY